MTRCLHAEAGNKIFSAYRKFRGTLLFLAALLANSLGASAQTTVTLGSGTVTTSSLPVNSCKGYNYSQQLYMQPDMEAAGASGGPCLISSVSFRFTKLDDASAFSSSCKDWVVYMGNTTKSSFASSSDWVPFSALTKVFDGTVTPTGTGWYKISFPTPFFWDGISNLAIAVDENSAGTYCTASFSATSWPVMRGIYYNSDVTDPDPAALPAASFRATGVPDIRFEFMPGPDCTGTPAGGTASVSAATACPGDSVKMSISGETIASALAYQWESAPDAAGPWTPISGASGRSLKIAPADCDTTFYRRVTTCTASGMTASSSTVSVSVSCRAAMPYLETFEGVTAINKLPSCMTATRIAPYVYTDLAAKTYNRSNHTAGGSKYAYFSFSSNDYLFTPELMLTAGKSYRFSVWYITDGYSGWTTLSAKIGTAATAAAMTTTVASVSNPVNTAYRELTGIFTASTTGGYYLAIYCRGNGDPWYLSIDDISLQELPACTGKPVAGTAVATPDRICDTGSPTLSLKGTSAISDLGFQWESSATAAPGSFTPIPGGTTTIFTAPAISSGTYYRAIVTCIPTGDTSHSSVIYVPAGPQDLPYLETFEGIKEENELPSCMSATSIAPNIYTYLEPTGWDNQENHTPGGSKFASFEYNSDDYLFTPKLKLTAGKTYRLSFWYITDGLGGWIKLSAKLGNAATAAAMTTTLGEISNPGNIVYKEFTTTFVATVTGAQVIGIYCNDDATPWYLSIDDISLQELPPCAGKPVAGTPVSDPQRICGTGSPILRLEGATMALALAYQWESSATGAAGSFTAIPGGITEVFAAPAISSGTYYRAVITCTLTGDTAISPAIYVDAGPYQLPYSETFESITKNNALPSCMEATRLSNYVLTYTAPTGSYKQTNHTPGGSKFASFRYAADDYLFTPGISFPGAYRYVLSFWYITDGLSGWTTLRGALGNDATPSAMSTTLKSISGAKNGSYMEYRDTFSISTAGIYYLGIYCKATGSPWYLSIDDISIQPLPCSGTPVAGVINSSLPSGGCLGTPVELRSTGATPSFIPGIVYRWQRSPVGAGTWTDVVGATADVYATDTAIGWDYRFSVTCTNSGLTSYSAVFSLPQLPTHPPVAITPGGSTLSYCLGDTVKLNATHHAGTGYDWMIDSVVVPGWKFSDMGATEPGIYTVKASSAAYPCPSWSEPVELVVNDPGYKVEITKPADSFLCDGDAVTINAMSDKAGVSYQWRRDNVDIPGATGTSLLVTSAGLYRVVANDGRSGCPAISRNLRFVFRPNPAAVIDIPGGSLTACEDKGVQLDANTGGYTYQWSRGGSPVFGWVDSSVLVKTSGVYSVKVRDASGCASVSADVTVHILPSPEPVIARSGVFPVITLTATAGYTDYTWMRTGAGSVSVEGTTNPLSPVMKKGMYYVEVTDVNGCKGRSVPIEIMDDGLSVPAAKAADIRVYPNPTESKAFIESVVPLKVLVKDAAGRSILELNGAREVDLSAYANGIYLFELHDMKTQELLKQQRVSKMTK